MLQNQAQPAPYLHLAPDLPTEPREELHEHRSTWRSRIERWIGERYLDKLLLRRGGVRAAIDTIPQRMQKLTNQARLVLELAEDFRTGAYRRIPWLALAAMAAALVYAVSPADVVPDVLPLVGTLDDFVVMAAVLGLVRRDLRAYCTFKGYDLDAYF